MQYYKNYQAVLAEQFVLMSTLTNQASYEAVLTIKRWKLMKKLQGLGKGYHYQIIGNIHHTFMDYVSCKAILDKEGFSLNSQLN